MLPAARSLTAPRWITPEPLNVAPALVGLPLASPWRRALAMGLDLLVVALLSGVAGLWLVGGLLLVLLQLRSQRGERTPRRTLVGWVLAGLLALLAVQEAVDHWERRNAPSTAARKADPGAASGALPAAAGEADEEDEDEALATLGDPGLSIAAAALKAASGVSDAQRVVLLEAALAEAQAQAQARKPRPMTLRGELDHLLHALGASFGWGIVYFSLLPAWWGGQTLGKKLLGLQVRELTGKPMTVLRCLRRYGGYAAGMATGGLGFLQLLWDDNRQAIQDRAAHTVVVDLRAAPAGDPPA